MSIYGSPKMEPIEQKLVSILEAGKAPSISDFGGLDNLYHDISSLSDSKLIPEFLRLGLQDLKNAQSFDKLTTFIVKCLDSLISDLDIKESINILDSAKGFLQEHYEQFAGVLLKIQTKNVCTPLAKAFALEGVLRFSVDSRKLQVKLLDFLFSLTDKSDPIFLQYASKIIGVYYSLYGEEDLLSTLIKLSNVEQACEEASYALGLAFVKKAINSNTRDLALKNIETAIYWLGKCIECSEVRPDAKLYLSSLNVLIGFYNNKEPLDILEVKENIAQNIFALIAWHDRSDNASWLGMRNIETIQWHELCISLVGLSKDLEKPSWYEPASVIENELLKVYSTSRCILKKSEEDGIERILRPQIEVQETFNCQTVEDLRKHV